MDNQQAYNQWSGSYDTVVNLTRDLEANAIRVVLGSFNLSEHRVLELGCGTGKNTGWLLERAKHLTGADFSEEMLARARKNLQAENLDFVQTDIREPWPFEPGHFQLIACSLVLEHIEDLHFIFAQAETALAPGGLLYIGELHPAKQYIGSKARFDTGAGVFQLDCFVHHVSDYLNLSHNNGLRLRVFEEWFDNNDRSTIPRLVVMVFQKPDR